MEENFDFTPKAVYGNVDFKKALVDGPTGLRASAAADFTEDGEPYMASLLGLTRDR